MHSVFYVHSNDAVVPALIAVIAFILSLAGWWIAWISGLVAMIICLVQVCADLPGMFDLTTAILACIAAVGDFLVAIRLVDGTAVCAGDNCFLNSLGVTIVAIVAVLLWLVVAVMAWRRR